MLGFFLLHEISRAFLFNGLHNPSSPDRPPRRSGLVQEDAGPWVRHSKPAESGPRFPAGWQVSWTSTLSLAAMAGLVAGLLAAPVNALDEKELQALSEMEKKNNILDPKDRSRILQYENEPAPQALVPRKENKKPMTENERLKEERLARDRALMASIPIEDGWKMKLWGLPEAGPSRKKKKSAAKAQAAKEEAGTADEANLSPPPWAKADSQDSSNPRRYMANSWAVVTNP